MADKSPIEQYLDVSQLSRKPTDGGLSPRERAKKWLESKDALLANIGSKINALRTAMSRLPHTTSEDPILENAKIIVTLTEAGGAINEVMNTPAGRSILQEIEKMSGTTHTQLKGLMMLMGVDVSHVGAGHSHDREGADGLDGIHDLEHTDEPSLKREIDNLLQKNWIQDVPGSAHIIKTYRDKLKDPNVSKSTLRSMYESLNAVGKAINGFHPATAQDIIDRVQKYRDSKEAKTNEASILLYGAIVHELNNLGFDIHFSRNNSVTISARDDSKSGEASTLESSFNGKTDVVEWLKRGVIINSSRWTEYMNSYPDKSTATVEKFMAVNKKYFEAHGNPYDKALLDSYTDGGFDIKGNDGQWIVGGMAIHDIAEASQQAAKKWKQMGYQSPLASSHPTASRFGEVAYSFAKVGFAAASVWKGTKAVWKTIFGDEAGMKSAWGDFGKTLALTGAVWYGGEAVKNYANDISGAVDSSNYIDSVKRLSDSSGEFPGMYDGFESIWNKIGGGYMPGLVTASGLVEGLMPSTVPAHQFKAMWEVMISGREGRGILDIPIQEFSQALENKYHTNKPGGSHVGGLSELFQKYGLSDVYDKFLIDRTTADRTRKFLRAIADHRSEDSFEGANDAIFPRSGNISTLFSKPLAKKTETPADLTPSFDEAGKAGREMLSTISILTTEVVEGGFKVVTFLANGVRSSIKVPGEVWDMMSPNDQKYAINILKGLGVAAAGVGAMMAINLIPGVGLAGVGLKLLGFGALAGGGYLGYKFWSSDKGFLTSAGDVLDYLKKMQGVGQTIKDRIVSLQGAGTDPKKILEALQAMPEYRSLEDGLKKGLEEFITPTTPVTPGGPSGPTGPAPTGPLRAPRP